MDRRGTASARPEECFSRQWQGSGTVSVQSSQVSPREGDITRRCTSKGPYIVAFTAHVTLFRSSWLHVCARVSFLSLSFFSFHSVFRFISLPFHPGWTYAARRVFPSLLFAFRCTFFSSLRILKVWKYVGKYTREEWSIQVKIPPNCDFDSTTIEFSGRVRLPIIKTLSTRVGKGSMHLSNWCIPSNKHHHHHP